MRAICTATVPTPPEAPFMSTEVPRPARATSRRACSAVSPTSATAAASTSATPAGIRATSVARGATSSASVPRPYRNSDSAPNTASPARMSPWGASTTPAKSTPHCFGKRSIRLSAQQGYVIKENLKDMHIEQARNTKEIRIGDKVTSDIGLHDFPPLVMEKVPKVKMYKFFITENQIVLVSPQNEIADIIKK